MPSGSGGLVNYFEDYHTKIEIRPEIVVGLVIGVILIVSMLHLFKPF